MCLGLVWHTGIPPKPVWKSDEREERREKGEREIVRREIGREKRDEREERRETGEREIVRGEKRKRSFHQSRWHLHQ